MLIIRPPGGKLTWLRSLGSRRHAAITAILSFFTGFLIADGYGACQELLPQLAGVQQCCQHVIRRCRAHEYADQVGLFTRQPAVDWTNNVSGQGAKAAKRRQAVSGYWHTQRTLARWCRVRNRPYPDRARPAGRHQRRALGGT